LEATGGLPGFDIQNIRRRTGFKFVVINFGQHIGTDFIPIAIGTAPAVDFGEKKMNLKNFK
jgi:hypothetical protein